jgi:hypothetical protein
VFIWILPILGWSFLAFFIYPLIYHLCSQIVLFVAVKQDVSVESMKWPSSIALHACRRVLFCAPFHISLDLAHAQVTNHSSGCITSFNTAPQSKQNPTCCKQYSDQFSRLGNFRINSYNTLEPYAQNFKPQYTIETLHAKTSKLKPNPCHNLFDETQKYSI